VGVARAVSLTGDLNSSSNRLKPPAVPTSLGITVESSEASLRSDDGRRRHHLRMKKKDEGRRKEWIQTS
jgi:hypothetical protein